MDGALAGMQYPREFIKTATPTLVAGRPASLLYLAGIPEAGVAPTPGIAGAALTSYGGQIPFGNPASGLTYLARFQAQATIAGTLLLCDRLWHNSGMTITQTTTQTFTGAVGLPARDVSGSTLGVGVYAALEISSSTGAGTPTITFTYTNAAGTTGRTASNVVPTVASSALGTFYPIGLMVGDTGVQKAEAVQLSASWSSGTMTVVLYRVLARLELQAQQGNAIDLITGGFVRLFDNTVPFLVFIPNTTTATAINGHMIVTQG
ncbi:MAG TPA: hypothetical protein DGH68_01945 [Bacteroidetes bacterium]|nr:hypothetical protein [Bacteroidota bacterium]